jgi:hypothetical protein
MHVRIPETNLNSCHVPIAGPDSRIQSVAHHRPQYRLNKPHIYEQGKERSSLREPIFVRRRILRRFWNQRSKRTQDPNIGKKIPRVSTWRFPEQSKKPDSSPPSLENPQQVRAELATSSKRHVVLQAFTYCLARQGKLLVCLSGTASKLGTFGMWKFEPAIGLSRRLLPLYGVLTVWMCPSRTSVLPEVVLLTRLVSVFVRMFRTGLALAKVPLRCVVVTSLVLFRVGEPRYAGGSKHTGGAG